MPPGGVSPGGSLFLRGDQKQEALTYVDPSRNQVNIRYAALRHFAG